MEDVCVRADRARLSAQVKVAGITPYGDIQVAVNPVGKTLPATYTAQPAKGQLSFPLKHADVPAEIRQRLRRRSSASLAQSMADAGGPTAPEGDQYAAVLEERAVNPNLATTNLQMARTTPNDIYQRQKVAELSLRIRLGCVP